MGSYNGARPYTVCRCKDMPSRPILTFSPSKRFCEPQPTVLAQPVPAIRPTLNPADRYDARRRWRISDVTRLRHRFLLSRKKNYVFRKDWPSFSSSLPPTQGIWCHTYAYTGKLVDFKIEISGWNACKMPCVSVPWVWWPVHAFRVWRFGESPGMPWSGICHFANKGQMRIAETNTVSNAVSTPRQEENMNRW
jgi:hypothetical protein